MLIWVEHVPVRRLLALIRGLPPEAATWRTDHYPPAEEMLAQLLERAEFFTRMRLAKPRQLVDVPAPLPDGRVPRPGDAARSRVRTEPSEIAAWFAKH